MTEEERNSWSHAQAMLRLLTLVHLRPGPEALDGRRDHGRKASQVEPCAAITMSRSV